jgi:Co/Zn/Cd efflux system component
MYRDILYGLIAVIIIVAFTWVLWTVIMDMLKRPALRDDLFVIIVFGLIVTGIWAYLFAAEKQSHLLSLWVCSFILYLMAFLQNRGYPFQTIWPTVCLLIFVPLIIIQIGNGTNKTSRLTFKTK